MTSIVLAFLAGLLSTLSPCVLPLLPLVLAGAAARHRFGPLALAAGLAVSFVAVGLTLATLGASLGFSGSGVRLGAAVMLIVIGVVLLVPWLNDQAAVAMGPLVAFGSQRLASFDDAGVSGQFVVGLLLGAVWSPCVGPTLGAASVLAAQGRDLGQVALTMAAFGVGAAVPLLIVTMISQRVVTRWRGGVGTVGAWVKQGLGAVLIASGLMIVTGLDKKAESLLVAWSPDWLTALTTAF